MRTPFVVIALLLAVLVPLAFVTEDDGEGDAAKTEPTAPIATIAERVETLRGLRFDTVPKPERVDAEQARREGLADLDSSYPPADRRADEDLYEMLGLFPEGTDLREVSAQLYGEGAVAGYYDPRSKQLRIINGAADANRVVDEMVIAHELDHALEDQVIGFDEEVLADGDDRAYAYKALVEGTATAVMYDYVGRYFDPGLALGGLLGSAFLPTGTEDLPPFVVEGLTFPYVSGQQFVAALHQRAGGRWTLVDLAQRTRPPTTTEQVLHPKKYLAGEPTLPVAGAPAPSGGGWKRLRQGTFGEWQTGQLVRDDEAAAGWGGDRYVLYGRGPEERRLRMRWRFDTGKDLREFASELRDAAADLPGARVTASAGRVQLDVSRA